MRRALSLTQSFEAVLLVAMYHARGLVTLVGMKAFGLALVSVVLLASCGGEARSEVVPAVAPVGTTYASAGGMVQQVAASGVALVDCGDEVRDITGGLSVLCSVEPTDVVSFSTYNNAAAAEAGAAYYADVNLNMVVSAHGSWVVLASSQALHDELVAALK